MSAVAFGGEGKALSADATEVESGAAYCLVPASNSNFALDAAGVVPSLSSNVSVWTENGGLNQG